MGLLDDITSIFREPYITALSMRVYENLFSLIESAWAQELDEFVFLNSSISGKIVIQQNEYAILLEHLLDYFIDREEYEICSEIRDILYEMNKKEPANENV